MEAEYELRGENIKVVIRTLICDESLNKTPSLNGSFIMDIGASPDIYDMSVEDINVEDAEEISPTKSDFDFNNEDFQYQKSLSRRSLFLTTYDEPNDHDGEALVNNLPPEFFKLLITKFSYRQLKVLMLVCKDWCHQIEDYFQEKTWLNCSKITKSDLFHLNKSTRVYQKLMIDQNSSQLENILFIIDKSKVTSIIFDNFLKVDETLEKMHGIRSLRFNNIHDGSILLNLHKLPKRLNSLAFDSREEIRNKTTLEFLIKNNVLLEELELVLPRTHLSLAFLSALSSLKRVTIHQPKWDKWLIFLSPSVKYLNIKLTNNQVNDPSFTSFLNKFDGLKEISINFLNQRGFHILWQTDSIRKINFSDLNRSYNMWNRCDENNTNLTSVTLSCRTISEKFMTLIHPSMPNLRYLSITSEKTSKISGVFFFKTATMLEKLETLKLSNFIITLTSTLRKLNKKCPPIPNLRNLLMQGCEFQMEFLQILNAPRLSSLTLLWCIENDIRTVHILSSNRYTFYKLKHIELCNVSSEVLFTIPEELQFLESIKSTVQLNCGVSMALEKILEISKIIPSLDLVLEGGINLEFFKVNLEFVANVNKDLKICEYFLVSFYSSKIVSFPGKNGNCFRISDDVREIRLKYLVRR